MTAAILAFTLLTAALEPDVIYFNGKIVTVNEQFEIVEAVAIRDGRFVAGGSNEEVRALVSPSTGFVDLEGQIVLPGFCEDHIHLGPSSRLQKWEQGYIPAVAEWCQKADTMEKLMAALAGQVRKTPKGEWILGGLTRPDWPNNKVLTRWELDEVAPDHPVMLTRGPHTFILNLESYS